MDVDRSSASISLPTSSHSSLSLPLESQADIFTRIRALLASRNEHHYSKAPSPTPVYSCRPHTQSSLPNYMESLDQDFAGSLARPVQQKARRSETVSAFFDGLKGQIAEMDGMKRSSSDPRKSLSRMRKSDGDLSERSGLDYRAMKDFFGRETLVIRNGIAIKALFEPTSHDDDKSEQQHTKLDLPQLVHKLELSPERIEEIKERLRPSNKSAPGSYTKDRGAGDQMTVSSATNRVVAICSCGAASGVPNRRSGTKGLISHSCSLCGTRNSRSEYAVGALDPMGFTRSSSSSFSTVKSRGLHQHSLLKPSNAALDLGLPLPPVLSSKLVHGESSAGSRNLEVLDSDSLATAAVESILKVTFHSDNPIDSQGSIRSSSLIGPKEPGNDVPTRSSSATTLKGITAGIGFEENSTVSDYAASSRAADQESLISRGRPNHTALSYEKLTAQSSLCEVAPPAELGRSKFPSNSLGTRKPRSTSNQHPIAPQVTKHSANLGSTIHDVDLGESPGGGAVRLVFPRLFRRHGNYPDGETARNFSPQAPSEESYTDSDPTGSSGTEETGRLRGSRKLPRWSYKEPKKPAIANKRRNSSSSVIRGRGAVADTVAAPRKRAVTVTGLYTKSPSYGEAVKRFRSQTTEPVSINPTQWIRQLFSNTHPKASEVRSLSLTARPLKPQYIQATATASDPLGPWCNPKFSNAENATSRAQYEKDRQIADAASEFQRRTSDSFSKMILDLEALLSEALVIAKEASERQVAGVVTETLQQATQQLHNRVKSDARSARNSAVLSPKTLSPNPPGADLQRDSQVSIHIASTRGYPSQNHSDSGSSADRVGSVGSEKSGSFNISTPTRRPGSGEELRLPYTHGRITIVEPESVDHDSLDPTLKRVADHLLTPYPNTPAAASEVSSLRASIQLGKSTDSTLLVGDIGSNRQSVTKKSPPFTRERQNYFEPSEADVSSNESNQKTPPRFYGNIKIQSTGRRPTRDRAHSTSGVFGGQCGKVGVMNSRQRIGEDQGFIHQDTHPIPKLPTQDDVRGYIKEYKTPPIQLRCSSSKLRCGKDYATATAVTEVPNRKRRPHLPRVSEGHIYYSEGLPTAKGKSKDGQPCGECGGQANRNSGKQSIKRPTLKDHRHISLRELRNFSLRRSHRHQPISRDWSTAKKRFTAAVACISTALVGIIVGVYAGEVPAIQYQITDLGHYAILGNVLLYIGLAIPTLVFWPLPLLHGRKPYTLVALALFMPLQFPQGLIVSTQRSPYDVVYRATLLSVRLVSGLALGFANINFKTTLLDLFGASLQSGNPHQERVIEDDVRRHGGGMGLWLGIWSWCFTASIGLGFLIGALIINKANPQWGFWLIVVLTAIVLLLNVLTPEVRRSAYRRSVAQVIKSTGEISRRIARGEIKMHISLTGPKWWWEEVNSGLSLSKRMMKQPGFFVVALYSSWIYGQIVMVVVLLGALTSRYYHFKPQYVGACVSAVPIGALLAVPFQKASLFSRSRHHPQRTDSNTFEKRISWSSHLVRRTSFMLSLPLADLAYTLASGGSATHFMVPTAFAGLIGFLSILAISECNGIIMETFDTSDLHRPTIVAPKAPTSDTEKSVLRRTNFSSYPRVSSALAITHTLGFIFAAIATAVGGVVERAIGAQAATGMVAGILLLFTLALIIVLWRWKVVQIVPDSYWLGQNRSENGTSRDEDKDAEEEEQWEPVIIGNPTGKTRRMSILELGSLSRWSEIRELNKMMAETGLSRWSQVRRSHMRRSLRKK